MEKIAADEVAGAVSDDNSSTESTIDKKAERRLLRKLDLHIIPIVTIMYLLAFLDRTNIGNARLAGLEKDLKMTGLDFNHSLMIFFPFYILSDFPSNIMMKKIRPSVWLPSMMVAWGVTCALMGVSQNFPGLLAARAALGFAEGGLFPGVAFYITMWYKRYECGTRIAGFFTAATVAGAFGGLLARGIMQMNGTGGYSAWRWIFILEGCLTVLVGCAAYFFMYDYPATAKFLSPTERVQVERRLEVDRSSLADEYDNKYVWQALKDGRTWVYCATTFTILTPVWGLGAFLPTIIRALGYQNETAQLMTVTPYAVACVVCFVANVAADRIRQRGIVQVAFALVSMIGFIILCVSNVPMTKYGATFLAITGIFTNAPLNVVWASNNTGGSTKRAVCLAMIAMCGSLGGVASSYVFLPSMAPSFKIGHAINIALTGSTLVISALNILYLRRENTRRDREYKKPEEYTPAELERERELGDRASFFRYTL